MRTNAKSFTANIASIIRYRERATVNPDRVAVAHFDVQAGTPPGVSGRKVAVLVHDSLYKTHVIASANNLERHRDDSAVSWLKVEVDRIMEQLVPYLAKRSPKL
jgi:hypothetical protein